MFRFRSTMFQSTQAQSQGNSGPIHADRRSSQKLTRECSTQVRNQSAQGMLEPQGETLRVDPRTTSSKLVRKRAHNQSFQRLNPQSKWQLKAALFGLALVSILGLASITCTSTSGEGSGHRRLLMFGGGGGFNRLRDTHHGQQAHAKGVRARQTKQEAEREKIQAAKKDRAERHAQQREAEDKRAMNTLLGKWCGENKDPFFTGEYLTKKIPMTMRFGSSMVSKEKKELPRFSTVQLLKEHEIITTKHGAKLLRVKVGEMGAKANIPHTDGKYYASIGWITAMEQTNGHIENHLTFVKCDD